MKDSRDIIYLPIRSFGDFIITATVVKSNFKEKIPILLPTYFVELFNAIEANRYFEIVEVINLNNQPALFELYKVRDWENIKRLFDDIIKLHAILKNTSSYVLDYRSRRMFFLNKNLNWPSTTDNIYQAKYNLFNKVFTLSNNKINIEVSKTNKSNFDVVIFPESRIKEKEINKLLISEILKKFGFNLNIKIARFSKVEDVTDQNTIVYSDFNQLIDLILKSDIVISAESLPYHLANYYNKPHFVIYNKSKHYNQNFMTQFMSDYNAYSMYDESASKETLLKLYSFFDTYLL